VDEGGCVVVPKFVVINFNCNTGKRNFFLLRI
jgi:hypothetical protein